MFVYVELNQAVLADDHYYLDEMRNENVYKQPVKISVIFIRKILIKDLKMAYFGVKCIMDQQFYYAASPFSSSTSNV
jgi:hypothetical protein